MELLIEHMGHGLMLSLIISLPCVLVAAGIGLVVGILQAVTQVQEQTIAAAPKILGVFAIILMGGGLMMTMLQNYVRESFQVAFNEIPQDGKFLLPPKANQAPGMRRARQFFQVQAKNGPGDKLKEFETAWSMPDMKETNGVSVTVTGRKHGAASALGVAEKMNLQGRH